MLDYAIAAESPRIVSSSATRILLVDDDRVGLAMLKDMLENFGHKVQTAENGAEAFAIIREDPAAIDIILTDSIMPVMDGVALTRRLKRDSECADIPIVMLTGAKEVDDIKTGIEAGAFYYLMKPAVPELVQSVLDSAMKEVSRKRGLAAKLGAHQSAFANVQVLRMVLSKPEEVESVCSLLASVHDRPEKVVQGIFELVQNSIEHGILRFGFEEKHRLLASGGWKQAVAERSKDPAYGQATVEATILRKPDSLILTVKDPGPGFVWRPYLTADMSRSSTLCGRGIARANSFIFDKLVYNAAGNEATALMALKPKARW